MKVIKERTQSPYSTMGLSYWYDGSDDEIQEVMLETITELSSTCRCTLQDTFGGQDGWYVIEPKGFIGHGEFEYEPDDIDGNKSYLALDRWQDLTVPRR